MVSFNFTENKNSSESVKYFFNTNYCVNGTTNPLLVAYSMKDRDLIRALLNFGADPSLADTKTNKNLTQLIYEDAQQASDEKSSMKQLLSDCFMQSIVQNDERALRQFVESGLEVNIRDESVVLPDQNTYLHWAALYANESVVRYLLDNGAEVNATNKYGATPLHECIAKRSIKDDKLKIIETLLVYKADAIGVKGSSGIFKDLTAYELAQSRHQSNLGSEAYLFIKEFLNETSSVPSTPMQPMSPLGKQHSVDSQHFALPTSHHHQQHQQHDASSDHSDNASQNSVAPSTIGEHTPLTHQRSTAHEFEQFVGWCQADASSNQPEQQQQQQQQLNDVSIGSLLWPQPQNLVILSDKYEDRFVLSKTPTYHVFIQPPNTFKLMDFVSRIASAFSGIGFVCCHKQPDTASYIHIAIDKSQFNHENSYSLLVTKSRVSITASDSSGLQYGLFTFIQLCKIFANKNIPSLRVNEHSIYIFFKLKNI